MIGAIEDCLRYALEAGFEGEMETIRREGIAGGTGGVLDLGCGTGLFSEVFEPSSYLGVDVDRGRVRRAKRAHARHRFCVMDGRDLALGSGVFDVVLIAGVIHHLRDADARKLLSEARRVLRPVSGRLVLWEDVPVRKKINMCGALVHFLDRGGHIRSEAEYVRLVRSVFEEARHYTMSSGVCDYVVFATGYGNGL